MKSDPTTIANHNKIPISSFEAKPLEESGPKANRGKLTGGAQRRKRTRERERERWQKGMRERKRENTWSGVFFCA
jgi:hypothetical protein